MCRASACIEAHRVLAVVLSFWLGSGCARPAPSLPFWSLPPAIWYLLDWSSCSFHL